VLERTSPFSQFKYRWSAIIAKLGKMKEFLFYCHLIMGFVNYFFSKMFLGYIKGKMFSGYIFFHGSIKSIDSILFSVCC